MLAGQFGLAAAVKSREPQLPLWSLMLCAQLIDVIFVSLYFLGIESISPAARMNTVPAPETESTTPPIAGPPKIPTLSIVLETTFAAVSSSGVRANAGVSAASADRNGVKLTLTAAASA